MGGVRATPLSRAAEVASSSAAPTKTIVVEAQWRPLLQAAAALTPPLLVGDTLMLLE